MGLLLGSLAGLAGWLRPLLTANNWEALLASLLDKVGVGWVPSESESAPFVCSCDRCCSGGRVHVPTLRTYLPT